MINLPPEQMGSFYLGAKYDTATRKISPEAVNYDARDLTTHAVCVGMTGSGKTGLCIGLLEEAAIDKVPALIIDPKGDMTNLMLQFPDLAATDFESWINADDASRKGMSVGDYAASISSKWEQGLGSWGQTKDRIRLLMDSVDINIYTPGSDAGIPINILGSFAAPSYSAGQDFDSDAEMHLERIQGIVAALLGMVESKADPVRSKEGILLANIFEHFWRKGQDLDLATLIKSIQSPPFSQLGVFDIETFFKTDDRFQLAMSFNTLIASPQFKYWLKGEDLNIDKLYYTPEGKPKHSIFYIAHLSESERMFFVTLLLNSLIAWMRQQSGTTSLRSLMYFDEIFGYFPPTSNPPSKKPLLTLLKQARAYGVGSVLVTQNPVDIDYKGLSNAGTWFIGKLQTERDKARVLDGLKGAIAEAGGKQMDFDDIITGLSSRVFLMHNVHADAPVIYHTRWAMSYLRGPMTRPQVKALMKDKKTGTPQVYASGVANLSQARAVVEDKPKVQMPPTLDHKIQQRFMALWKSPTESGLSFGQKKKICYEPRLLCPAQVRFYDEKRSVDKVTSMALLAAAPDEFGRTDWAAAMKVANWQQALLNQPDHPDNIDVEYKSVPESMNTVKELNQIESEFSDWLYVNQRMHTLQHEQLEIYQSDTESEESFRMRLQVRVREERDDEIDKLHDKYDAKFAKLDEKIRKEERDLDEAQAEQRSRRNDEFINVVETVFGGVFGGRRRRSSMGSVSTKRRMARKAKEKVAESREDLAMLDEARYEIENELKTKINSITEKWNQALQSVTKREIKPRRSDVKVSDPILVWYPYWEGSDGQRVSASE